MNKNANVQVSEVTENNGVYAQTLLIEDKPLITIFDPNKQIVEHNINSLGQFALVACIYEACHGIKLIMKDGPVVDPLTAATAIASSMLTVKDGNFSIVNPHNEEGEITWATVHYKDYFLSADQVLSGAKAIQAKMDPDNLEALDLAAEAYAILEAAIAEKDEETKDVKFVEAVKH